MPDDPAFIRMIAENPDDDAPRLVYADVLEESGEPLKVARAEFIRLDIEYHRLPMKDPRRDELRRHVREKLMPNVLAWWRELPSPQGIAWDWFVRGFAERLQARPNAFEAFAPQLFVGAPIRFVRLNNPCHYPLMGIARLSEMSRLHTLELTTPTANGQPPPNNIPHFVARAWSDSPYLSGLACLRVPRVMLDAQAESILMKQFGSKLKLYP